MGNFVGKEKKILIAIFPFLSLFLLLVGRWVIFKHFSNLEVIIALGNCILVKISLRESRMEVSAI